MIWTTPLVLFKDYRKAIRDNYHGSLPFSEKAVELAVIVMATACIYFSKCGIQSALISNLITVHGIFLSVLVASYAPFLDFLKPNGPQLSTNPNKGLSGKIRELDTSLEIENAQATVKRLLFTSNSFSIFLSLSIVILLCLSDFFPPVKDFSFSNDDVIGNLQKCATIFFHFSLFYLVITNALVLIRVISTMSRFAHRHLK